jgi:hypothetical protein
MNQYKITYSDEIEVIENPVFVTSNCEESAISVADRIGMGQDSCGNRARVESVEAVLVETIHRKLSQTNPTNNPYFPE